MGILCRVLILPLLIILAAVPAAAGTFTHNTVTLEVPAGWTTHLPNKDIDQILLQSPDTACRVLVTFSRSFGLDSRQHAEMLAKRIFGSNATSPEPVPGRNVYRFTAKMENSPESEITVFSHGPAMLHWGEVGETGKYADDIKIIWNSLHSSDPGQQALINALYKL